MSITTLQLESYFNTKIVSWKKPKINGSFADFSLPGEVLPNNSVFYHNEIPFVFPITNTHSNDVISCLGQNIPIINPNYYNKISLLGLACYGHQYGYVTLEYEDGTEVNSLIRFNENTNVNTYDYSGDPAITLPFLRRLDDEVKVASAIEVIDIVVNESKILKTITTPENPFILLLSITAL